MDTELIKLVQQTVNEGITSASWFIILMSLIAAALGAFGGSYLKKRAEDIAIKQNFEEFLRQLKTQTKATEEIKGEISKRIISATEKLRTELSKELEHVKSELSVWTGFRNDALKDMWTAHRAVVDAMTSAILRTQQAEAEGKIADIRTEITIYRTSVHRSIDLLTPRAVDLAERFLETSNNIASLRTPPDDANPLKSIRRQFYEHMAQHFHLEEVLPWMIREASQNQPKA